MSTGRNVAVVGVGLVAAGLAVWLLGAPGADAPTDLPAAEPGVPAHEDDAAPAAAVPAATEPVEVAAAADAPAAAATTGAPLYDDDEARKGPFDLSAEGAAELVKAHHQRSQACRRLLAGKAKGPIRVKLTVRASEEGPGYVAAVAPTDDLEGVNAAFGPCLLDAFAEARFPSPFEDRELEATIPSP